MAKFNQTWYKLSLGKRIKNSTLGQFNLIDRLSSLSAPQNLACHNFFYFVKITFFGLIYGFTSHSRIFHLYGDITIAGEGLQNLGLCSALWACEQGGMFIVPHLLWHGTSIIPVSSEGPPQSVASLWHTWGCGGSILTRIHGVCIQCWYLYYFIFS